MGEVTTATIATTPANTTPTTFRSISGFALPSWFTTTNVSYRFPVLKLPPPPCAVLLVYWLYNLVQQKLLNHQPVAHLVCCPFLPRSFSARVCAGVSRAGAKAEVGNMDRLPRPSPGFAPAFVGRIHNVLLCVCVCARWFLLFAQITDIARIGIPHFSPTPLWVFAPRLFPSVSIISCIPSVNQYSDRCWCDMFISRFCCNPQFSHNPITSESPATAIRDSPRWGGGSKSVHEEKAEEAHEAIAVPPWEFGSCQGRPFVTFEMLWARFLIFWTKKLSLEFLTEKLLTLSFGDGRLHCFLFSSFSISFLVCFVAIITHQLQQYMHRISMDKAGLSNAMVNLTLAARRGPFAIFKVHALKLLHLGGPMFCQEETEDYMWLDSHIHAFSMCMAIWICRYWLFTVSFYMRILKLLVHSTSTAWSISLIHYSRNGLGMYLLYFFISLCFLVYRLFKLPWQPKTCRRTSAAGLWLCFWLTL